MTQDVVTAETDDSLRRVGELMRDRNVGSVVICDGDRPVGVITDRDLALAVVADGVDAGEASGAHASRPLVTGEVEMDIEEAVALMVQHRIRRLPVTDGDGWPASSRSTTSPCAPATCTRRSRSPPRWPRRRCPSSTSTSGAADGCRYPGPAADARAGGDA